MQTAGFDIHHFHSSNCGVWVVWVWSKPWYSNTVPIMLQHLAKLDFKTNVMLTDKQRVQQRLEIQVSKSGKKTFRYGEKGGLVFRIPGSQAIGTSPSKAADDSGFRAVDV